MRAADDFAAIHERLAEIASGPPAPDGSPAPRKCAACLHLVKFGEACAMPAHDTKGLCPLNPPKG